jgi:hypothetical protein
MKISPAAAPDPAMVAAAAEARWAANERLVKGVLAILGLALIILGIALWSRPAGLIVAGAMLFAYAYLTTHAPVNAPVKKK